MEAHLYDIQVRVLICKEDGEFVARALEMDLLGYGKTAGEALQDLRKAIEAQISFAHQMKDDSLIKFSAEQEYFERWEDAQRKSLLSAIRGDRSIEVKSRTAMLAFDLKALLSKSPTFRETKQLVCA